MQQCMAVSFSEVTSNFLKLTAMVLLPNTFLIMGELFLLVLPLPKKQGASLAFLIMQEQKQPLQAIAEHGHGI